MEHASRTHDTTPRPLIPGACKVSSLRFDTLQAAMRLILANSITGLVACLVAVPSIAVSEPIAPYRIVGDSIPEALNGLEGDPDRGRGIVAGRAGNCLACHQAPISEEPFHGDLGPPLDGIGSRASAGTLRLRLVAPQALNPDTVMPALHRVDGLKRVAEGYRGRPILDAQAVEDVIAYLLTLR